MTEEKNKLFSEFFTSNLKEAVSNLVSRDHRLKLFPSDFWVIDKRIARNTEKVPFSNIAQLLSTTALENVPWAYDFKVRAKVFQDMIQQKKINEYAGNESILFRVRRDHIFEDSFAVYRSHAYFNATKRFKIVFVDA